MLPQLKRKEEEKELTKIIEKSALEFNKKFLNKIVDILILKKKNGFYFGKTRHYQTIKIPITGATRSGLMGKFVKVKVTKITPYGLEGKIQ